MIVSCVSNASAPLLPELKEWLEQSDRVVAVDGGLDTCMNISCVPDLVVGDGDSMSREAQRYAKSLGWQPAPKEKDQSDFELALEAISEWPASRVRAFQSLDDRWDYNFDAFLAASQKSFPLEFWTERSLSFILNSQNSIFKWPRPEFAEIQWTGRLSVFPLSSRFSVEAKGLKWPISWKAQSLPCRSLSNEISGRELELQLLEGALAVLFERKI
ncbi:MAG: thiamine diphosphokinase [Bradymonadales bacterium]|nr:MAG: thiamine diphosphokinase [Bradymonadales bacterium]